MDHISLLDRAAAMLKCCCLSDLHYLSAEQQATLEEYLRNLDQTEHTLFEWNDALQYLSQADAEKSIDTAREKLLRSLHSA